MRSFVRADDQAEINMTPMLDIVFIMLIFFIVTAIYIKEQGLLLNQPESDQPQVLNPDEPALLLQVDASGTYFFDGDRVLATSIKPRVAKRLAENPDQVIVILPAFDAPTGKAVWLYDQVLQVDEGANVVISE